MALMFVWMIVSIAGGVLQGSVSIATTVLTADLTDADVIINVTSTTGFTDTGFVTILDERIGYASKTATTFRGNFAQPLVRGASDTEATEHTAGELVRTIESSMMNQSLGYNLAVLSDASGVIAFVTIPFAFISLLTSFFVLPLSFLGTDLEILTYIWGILSIGIIVSLGIALVGGRRV
ncbi:hypothetical protein LCGC14_0539880 [marine sediment metagenome]|uniref:Uncharacterized protein n=1 Tax=marine sediment metagenome TaxID=412755 RepID=A0A0F9UEI8_9ZZZZ